MARTPTRTDALPTPPPDANSPAPDALAIARRVLETMLGCPVSLVDDLPTFLAELEARSCFDARLQPGLTAGLLGDFATGMGREVVHELIEPLGVRLVLFWLEETLLVIGPYTGRALLAGEAESLLGGLRIPSAQLAPYQLYRAGFPIVDSDQAIRAATALAGLVGIEGDELAIQRVRTGAAAAEATAGESPRSASLEVVNERYANEAEYMQAVEAGDQRRALAALQRMGAVEEQPSYLRTPHLGLTILRIMTRIAAQNAGLPPVTIDAISQTHAQRLHRSRHSPNARQATPEAVAMVVEFCRRVHQHRQRPYSWLVRQVVDEIELHLSQPVSPSELALRLEVSTSQLARRFKAETGCTISGYVARERSRVAARLLTSTQHPVRDIAAYVGYLDANYFVKVFRSVHGMTPTEYRTRHAP